MRLYIVLLILFSTQINAQTLKDCSVCSTQFIKKEQVKNLSIDEIRFLTNEMYARHGYQFENVRFQNFFEEKPWYKSKNDNKNIVLNEIEKKNVKLFQEITEELKNGRKELANQFKIFKNLILSDQKDELGTKFGFYYDRETGDNEAKSLKEVLKKINLDDINYYKNEGLNSTMTDNGFVKIVYEVAIENENVNLYYNYMAHSKIIKDFDAFTDYDSENEYMYNWQFEFKNNKLKFIRLMIAG